MTARAMRFEYGAVENDALSKGAQKKLRKVALALRTWPWYIRHGNVSMAHHLAWRTTGGRPPVGEARGHTVPPEVSVIESLSYYHPEELQTATSQ